MKRKSFSGEVLFVVKKVIKTKERKNTLGRR